MDNLGKAAEYFEKVTSEMDGGRTIALRARETIMALRLATAGVLALVDMAVSLRVLSGEPPPDRRPLNVGYAEDVDAANQA